MSMHALGDKGGTKPHSPSGFGFCPDLHSVVSSSDIARKRRTATMTTAVAKPAGRAGVHR
jgi:hypothetical protein